MMFSNKNGSNKITLFQKGILKNRNLDMAFRLKINAE